jgi:ankyrin repeat protein
MDDVVVDISTQNNKQLRLAIQLKQKENKHKKLSPGSFEAQTGNFSLKKYCQAFKNLTDQNKQSQFILYTNADFDPHRKEEVTNFKMIEDHQSDVNLLLNTSFDGRNVYKFEVNENTPEEEEMTKSDYEEFLSRFRLFVCQKNFQDLEQDLIEILHNENIVLKYLNLFRKWHQGRFTNKTIDKATVNVHLIDIFLSPFVITDSCLFDSKNRNLALFDKAIQEFDLTLINETCKDFLEKFSEEVEEEEEDSNMLSDERFMLLAKEHKIIEKSVTQLERAIKLKLLHYFCRKPLIVDFNETSQSLIYKIMELLQLENEIKFVLLGREIHTKKLSRFRIFENLDNLCNQTLYTDIVRACRLSLQGRNEITLEELIDSFVEIRGFVGTKELLQMLKGNFLIGQEKESMPFYYIHRKISANVLKLDTLLDPTFLKENLLVVNFYGKLEQLQAKFRFHKINIVNSSDYIMSREVPEDPILISTSEQFSEKLLVDICKRETFRSVWYLKMIDDDSFVTVRWIKKVLEKLTWKKTSVTEEKIADYFDRSVNILCAHPGMGKSTMLRRLRNECDSTFWTVGVDLKAHNKFLRSKKPVNVFLRYLLNANDNVFSEQVRNVFWSTKKVVFFLDGLDEIENICVDNVLSYVQELSSKGFRVWISSRKNLKEKLESSFGEFLIDLEEIDKEQQQIYIKSRLQEEYRAEEIENVIGKIFSSADIVNNCQVLGIPLQLYVITQTFLDDKELYHNLTENIFILTKMYKFFFHGRFKHNRDKEQSKNPHLDLTEVEDTLEKYEPLALQSLFDNNIFEKLNIDMRRSRRFLNEVKTNKDPLGIVITVSGEDKAIFEHYTYAEYFAAKFFANSFDNARLLQEELFSDRYKNLMMIFSLILAEENPLHLAVIYRDVDLVVRSMEDKNTYDKGGRSPLHIAACSGERFGISRTTGVKENNLQDILILEHVVKFDHLEQDKLFKWNSLDYAFRNKCLISAELILRKYGSCRQASKYFLSYADDVRFVQFCIKHGCPHLMSAVLKHEGCLLIPYVNSFLFSLLIKISIRSCYFQKKEMLAHLFTVADNPVKHGDDEVNILYFTIRNKCFNWRKSLQEKDSTLKVGIAEIITVNQEDENLYLSDIDKSELIDLFIKHGFSLNAKNIDGDTVLHLFVENETLDAAAEIDLQVIDLLIRKGIDVDARNKKGVTPLHSAARSGSYDMVAKLLDVGADPRLVTLDGNNVVHVAVLGKNTEVINLFLTKGLDVNSSNNQKETPLHFAGRSGHMSVINFLLEKGARIDSVSAKKETTLHWAVRSGSCEIVEFFIDRGLDIDSANSEEETALLLALKMQNIDVIKLLLARGASRKDSKVVYEAAQLADSKLMNLLLSEGFCINVANDRGETALHLAAQEGSVDAAVFLIENEAFVDVFTHDNISPLHLAVYRGSLQFVRFLLRKGVDLTRVDVRNEKYPLHEAVEDGQLDETLLRKMTIRIHLQNCKPGKSHWWCLSCTNNIYFQEMLKAARKNKENSS